MGTISIRKVTAGVSISGNELGVKRNSGCVELFFDTKQ